MESERGFALIEPLVVISVLGILASIVVISVGSIRKRAAEPACNTGMTSVELSAEAYNKERANARNHPHRSARR